MVRVISLILFLLMGSTLSFATESFDDETVDEADTNYTDAYDMKQTAVKPSLTKAKSASIRYKQGKRQPGERSDRGLPFPEDDLEDDLK